MAARNLSSIVLAGTLLLGIAATRTHAQGPPSVPNGNSLKRPDAKDARAFGDRRLFDRLGRATSWWIPSRWLPGLAPAERATSWARTERRSWAGSGRIRLP